MQREPFKIIGYLLLGFGVASLLFSTFFELSVLAFIGLGLTFWGALFLYVRSEEYVKEDILTYTLIPTLADNYRILTELGYQGKGIYLPPRYFNNFETSKVFISKKTKTNLPTEEEIQQEGDKVFLENREAALINPPGLLLAKLLEKKLGKGFAEVDLKYLEKKLPRLFIEDLEIAEDLEIKIMGDTINVKVDNSVYNDIYLENERLSISFGALGDPFFSAIACAFAKSTRKPVVIEKIQASPDGKTIEANFRLLEKIEFEHQESLVLSQVVTRLRFDGIFQRVISLSLIAIGLITLAWVGWLTLYDMTTWGKDLALIFLGSRSGEAISLGIGMKVAYYFLTGLALLLSGILISFRRKRGKV